HGRIIRVRMGCIIIDVQLRGNNTQTGVPRTRLKRFPPNSRAFSRLVHVLGERYPRDPVMPITTIPFELGLVQE
ncbi:MAG: hypothetical protein ACQESR_30645, partial [Planctomycetota bacterium]